MKFGLFGTGPWATDVQGPALAASPEVELVGVWGRDPAKAGVLADALGCRAYPDQDQLTSDVDAVAVALPPYVQAPIALQAARAGRHLLLDKPVALDLAEADALLAEVSARNLAALVFFTNRFQPDVTEFLAAGGDWHAGRVFSHASILRDGSPFGASPWRREYGGLWDIGPHALSVLLPALGGVSEVSAMTGPYDTTYLLLRHQTGTVSTMSLTVDAPPAAAVRESVLYGPEGPVSLPGGSRTPLAAFTGAIEELLRQVADGAPPHPCDLRLGRDVVAILTAAATARATGATVPVAASGGVTGSG